MKPTPLRHATRVISIGAILLPLLIMVFNLEVGFALFVLGIFISGRIFLLARDDEDDALNERDRQKNERMQVNRSNIIMVQTVDDKGRDLPPHIIEQKMKEARLRAGPRDTVMPVRKPLKKDVPHN